MGAIIDESLVLLELGLSGSATDEEKAMVTLGVRRAEGAVKRYLRYDPAQRVRTEFYPREDADSNGSRAQIWEADSDEAYVRRLASASSDQLQLSHLPVRQKDTAGANAIDLRIDYDGRFGTRSGSFAAPTQQTEGTDFWPVYDLLDSSGYGVCSDGILRSEGRWPGTPGAVKVTYLAGYTAAELNGQDAKLDASPITGAVLTESARIIKRALVVYKKGRAGHVAGPLISERLGDYSYQLGGAAATTLFGGTWDLLPETVERLRDYVNFAAFL